MMPQVEVVKMRPQQLMADSYRGGSDPEDIQTPPGQDIDDDDNRSRRFDAWDDEEEDF